MQRSAAWVAPVIVAAIAAIVVAGAGMTVTELGPWYRALEKPGWTPPDWMFGPVWTAIFALTAIAGVSAWRRTPNDAAAYNLIGLFAFNGFLNLLWSFLFFKLRRPDWALVEAVVFWLSILALILLCRRYSWLAALLLVPYLVWVGLATILNYQVVQLNAPFG